jgi:GTPase SAR1 family protein
MSVTVKKHPEYKLRRPKFLVDYILKEGVPPPFNFLVDGFKLVLITGNSGSGKTSFLISLLTDKQLLKKVWNNVVVCIPETSRKSLKKDPFKDLDPSKQFEDLSEVDKIYEMIRFYSSEGESTLLILDDQQSFLKDYHTAQVINHIASNRRHLHCTILILLQTYNQLALKTRKLTNVLVAFKPSRKEWVNICEELLEYDDDTNDKLFKLSFPKGDDNRHKWILLDVSSQRYFCGFDEFEVKENSI